MNILQRLVSYLRHSYAELLKVVWPSKEEVTRYSVLIVVVSVVAAVFFATLDTGLNSGMSAILRGRTPVAPAASNTIIPEDSLQPIQVEAEPVTETNANPLTAPVVSTTVSN